MTQLMQMKLYTAKKPQVTDVFVIFLSSLIVCGLSVSVLGVYLLLTFLCLIVYINE